MDTLRGKQLVTSEEMVAKIRAACDARSDPEFVVIARTDAIAVEGLESALERGEQYVDAGADMLFVEAPPVLNRSRILQNTSATCLCCTTSLQAGKHLTHRG